MRNFLASLSAHSHLHVLRGGWIVLSSFTAESAEVNEEGCGSARRMMPSIAAWVI